MQKIKNTKKYTNTKAKTCKIQSASQIEVEELIRSKIGYDRLALPSYYSHLQ